jgi:hypothetical protein
MPITGSKDTNWEPDWFNAVALDSQSAMVNAL